MARCTRREFLATASMGYCLLTTPAWGAAPQRWFDRREVGPFVCHADFCLSDYETLLAELAPLELELRRVLGLRPCRSSVQLFLLADRQRHRACLAERFPGVPYRRALFVKQNQQANLFVYRHPDLADDVRHECTHALLHADLPSLPLWLDEGLAEYFEVAAADRPRRHPHQRALRWNVRLGLFTDLHQLEAKTALEEFTVADYQQAWAWIHYLLHGTQTGHAELVRYLAQLRSGHAPGPFSQQLANSLPQSSLRLARHFRHWTRR